MRAARAVLFDMDGLLLDTENLYTEGTQSILSQYGKEYSWEFKAKLMGKNTQEVANMIVENYQLPITPQEWIQRSQEVYSQLFPTVKSLPGVTKVVHHLAKHRVPIAVATSSSSSSFLVKTERHSGLFSLFDAIVKGDHPAVKRAKPSPDTFLVACSQLQASGGDGEIKPEDCLVVEDAPLGVEAGLAAGMQVVMVPHPRLDPSLCQEAATLSLSNLHQFQPEMFGLPPYSYKPVTHVLFDMDGLLLNTQEMYSSVGAQLLAEHGKTSDWDFKMKVIGRRADEVADLVVKHYGLPYTGPEYLALHSARLTGLFPTCCLLPGVEGLVRHLHAHNIPIAVATSSSRQVMELKTQQKHSEFFSLFSHVVTGSDPEISRGKPDPQIFVRCMERFGGGGVQPGQCLVFEDAPNGVTAGLAAGMQVVMIPHHKTAKEHLLPATQVLPTMEDFQPQDFGLPPYPQ